jgi:hypothetical protein
MQETFRLLLPWRRAIQVNLPDSMVGNREATRWIRESMLQSRSKDGEFDRKFAA